MTIPAMDTTAPILIIGGFASHWQTYRPLQAILQTVAQRQVFIAPLTLLDWLGVLVSDDYGGLLQQLDQSVQATLRATNAERLVIVAHSAGGVLARIYMGDQVYGRQRLVFNGFQRVETLLTLGTPHTTARSGRIAGLNQVAFVQRTYPGAYWRFIRYVSVMGRAVQGKRNGTASERNAWQSYQLVATDGGLAGDGIIPLAYGLLEGAQHIILDGIRHDPRPGAPWYGQDAEVVRRWWGPGHEIV